MGIAVFILNILNQLQIEDAITLLSLGITCISMPLLINEKDVKK